MGIERIRAWLAGLYKFPPGAMIFCLDYIIQQLEKLGEQKLADEARDARDKCEIAIEKRVDWDQDKQQSAAARPGTRELDDKIDSTLTQIRDAAEIFADMEHETDQKEAAEEFMGELFPAGVYPITSKKFGEQQADVEAYVGRMRGPLSAHVDKMSLNDLVDQLEELNQEFGEKLDTTGEQIEYDEVEAAIVEAEDAFDKVLAGVMYKYGDDMETFNQIVEAVHAQTRRTRRHLQRSGTIPPVDPDSGEAVDSPGEGAGEPVDGEPSGGSNDGGTPNETDGEESSGDSTSDGTNSDGNNEV